MASSAISNLRQPSRKGSLDPRNDINIQEDHYIGIDVGTGSARACIINEKGDIVGLASKNIGLWQPETGYYVSCQILVGWKTTDYHHRNNLPLTFGVVYVTV